MQKLVSYSSPIPISRCTPSTCLVCEFDFMNPVRVELLLYALAWSEISAKLVWGEARSILRGGWLG